MPNLAEGFGGLLLEQRIDLGGALDGDGEDLGVLEREAAEQDGQAVDKAQGGDAVAVGEVGIEGAEGDSEAEGEDDLGEREAADLRGRGQVRAGGGHQRGCCCGMHC